MRAVVLIIFILCNVPTLAQGNWKLLTDVEILTRMDQEQGYEISYPKFGESVLKLDNQPITLKGYMIPLDDMIGQHYFVLSALPFNICFFCGGAGPETVAEVKTKSEVRFTDAAITVRGTLKLNPDDPDHLMYIIEDAEIIDP
ncbi:MAG: hypothetical protein RIC80_12940 [Cyclobacteriaceae bacterium]